MIEIRHVPEDVHRALEALAALAERLFATREALHAPHLIDAEVAQVLRRLARRGELAAQRAAQAFEDLAALPLTRHAHEPLLERVWALRDNATACDACYLVLAEALGGTLVTCDAALRDIPGCRARVDVFR